MLLSLLSIHLLLAAAQTLELATRIVQELEGRNQIPPSMRVTPDPCFVRNSGGVSIRGLVPIGWSWLDKGKGNFLNLSSSASGNPRYDIGYVDLGGTLYEKLVEDYMTRNGLRICVTVYR